MKARDLPVPTAWQGLKQALLCCKALYHEGRLQEAEALLCDALEFAPIEPKVWAWLGQVRKCQGRDQAAAEAFAQARRLLAHRTVGRGEPASLDLAKLLWQQGARAEGLAMLNVVIEQEGASACLLEKKRAWERE
jgi:tetratricopeptide (TPR) repeat protein